MRRFERIYDDVEPVEEYRRGGYHPVHLHDIFHQRYKVMAKLAYGQFSTVWLALDQIAQQHVALKILKADASKDSNELSILLRLSDPSLDHPGKEHVLELFDHFEHHGPNGTHLCLVLPVMMSDSQMMTVRHKQRQASYVRTISKRILLGLDFLHGLGIIHGGRLALQGDGSAAVGIMLTESLDLQPVNIMFSIIGAALGEVPLEPPEYSPVKWLKGVNADDSAPLYLMISQRPRGTLDDADFSTLLVKVGDMGGAICSDQHDQKPVTPTALRAPELIRRNPWDASIDIWALGCLIFQLATNQPLFPLGCFGLTAEEINEEHEALIHERIDEDDETHERFSAYLSQRLPSDFGIENVQQLASFLRSMLQRDPRARKSTMDLLKDPFLAGKTGNWES